MNTISLLRIRNNGGSVRQFFLVKQDVEHAKCEDARHMHTECHKKEEEIAIVPSPYAVVDPWAMVIKGLKQNK